LLGTSYWQNHMSGNATYQVLASNRDMFGPRCARK
jgi:hypothetical protein